MQLIIDMTAIIRKSDVISDFWRGLCTCLLSFILFPWVVCGADDALVSIEGSKEIKSITVNGKINKDKESFVDGIRIPKGATTVVTASDGSKKKIPWSVINNKIESGDFIERDDAYLGTLYIGNDEWKASGGQSDGGSIGGGGEGWGSTGVGGSTRAGGSTGVGGSTGGGNNGKSEVFNYVKVAGVILMGALIPIALMMWLVFAPSVEGWPSEMQRRYWRVRPIQQLSQGGIAMIWLARIYPLPRVVAVKLLLPKHFPNRNIYVRFLKEGRVISVLRKTKAVPMVHGLCSVNEQACPWYAMEYLSGMKRLRDVVGGKTHLCLPRKWAFKVGAALCESVYRIHRKNVIHRDLSPENVMVSFGKGTAVKVKLIDFDAARLLSSMPELENLEPVNSGGMIIGKTNYSSPEQWIDFDSADQRSDAYVVGIMLYECLVGEVPFEGGSIVATRQQHRLASREEARLKLISKGVPRRIAMTITDLFSHDPAKRPALDLVCSLLLQVDEKALK